MTTEYVFDLWFHPETGGWAARQKRGTFDTLEAAAAATEFPETSQWGKSGTYDWILDDPIIDGAGREFSWYTITRERKHEPLPQPSGELITLRLVQHGETSIQVDAGLYAAAKAAGRVDNFLDTWVSDIDTETTITEIPTPAARES